MYKTLKILTIFTYYDISTKDYNMNSKIGKIHISEKDKPVFKALFRLILKLLIIGLIFYIALTFVFGVFRLSGNNMYPALKDGDLCVTYKLADYYDNDVVAYHVGDEVRFGRIIARAGETVDGDAEGLFLNGARITEEIFYPTKMLDTNLELPVTLGDGEYIVLNDYREDMNDSRTYGVVTKDKLSGKIIFIFRRRGF